MGMTMNSWKSTELSACAPPFRMFIIGQGRRFADFSEEQRARYLYSGTFCAAAAPRAAAIETARMALAPRRDLVGVPSSSIIRLSSARWLVASRPTTALAISWLTLATAFNTPLPRYFDLSPSRSSRRSEEHTSEL